jgi:protein required for attachment to host cells
MLPRNAISQTAVTRFRSGDTRTVTREGGPKCHIERINRVYSEVSVRAFAKDADNSYGNDWDSHEAVLIHKGKMAMYERAAQFHKLLVTWVLVADGKRAQIYDCRKTMQKIPLVGTNKHHYYDEKSDHKLVPVQNGVTESESIDDYQTGHDRRGTASSSNSPTHNTYEPRGDIDEELKRRFAKSITTKLQQACVNNSFDRLILVAPAKMINELRGQLSDEVQDRVVGVLPKDLTHYRNQVVMSHLHEMLAGIPVE